MNNWKDRIIIIWDGDIYKGSKFEGEEWEVFFGFVSFEFFIKYLSWNIKYRGICLFLNFKRVVWVSNIRIWEI